METPTVISMLWWSDRKTYSESLLFSSTNTKSHLLLSLDRYLWQSELNRGGCLIVSPCYFSLSELSLLKQTLSFTGRSNFELCEPSPLQIDEIQMWSQSREKLHFLTYIMAAGRGTKTKSFTFSLLSITLYQKSHCFRAKKLLFQLKRCRLCRDLNFVLQQSERAAYQLELVVWM